MEIAHIIRPRPEPAPGEPKEYGKHVYGNHYNCDREVLSNEERLRQIVVNAAKLGSMTLLDVRSWKIGEGVSVVAIVLESHITIHSWPEYAFATVDVYSCGKHTNPEKAFDYIAAALRAQRVERKVTTRNLE